MYEVIEECRRFLQTHFESERAGLVKQARAPKPPRGPEVPQGELFVKPELTDVDNYVVAKRERAPGESAYEKEQLEELEALQKTFASFRMVPRTDLKSFAIRLAPTKRPQADLLLVDVLFGLTEQYPHDYPDIAVTCVSDHGTKRHAQGLRNFLLKYAERHYGRKLIFELLERAKTWLVDQNNFLLIKQGWEQYLEIPPFVEVPEVIVNLQQFELEGKMKLVNLACTSIVSEVSFGNIWTPRKMDIVTCVGISFSSLSFFFFMLPFFVHGHVAGLPNRVFRP